LTVIVIDSINRSLTAANVRIANNRRVAWIASHPRSKRSRRELKAPAEFNSKRPPGAESWGFCQIHDSEAILRTRSGAERATPCRSWGLDERLTSAADAHLHRLPKGIRSRNAPTPSRTDIHDPNGGVELVIFDGLGAGSELTDGDVDSSIDYTSRVATVYQGIVMIQISHPRRKSKHRKHSI
jgi:hypothetical protein